MPVPLATLNPILMDKPALKRNKLRIRALHALRRLHEPPNRARARVPKDRLEQALQPLREEPRRVRVRVLRERDLVEELLQLAAGLLLLGVERDGRGLEPLDGAAQAGEVGGGVQGGGDVLDAVEVVVELERVVRCVEREDD